MLLNSYLQIVCIGGKKTVEEFIIGENAKSDILILPRDIVPQWQIQDFWKWGSYV